MGARIGPTTAALQPICRELAVEQFLAGAAKARTTDYTDNPAKLRGRPSNAVVDPLLRMKPHWGLAAFAELGRCSEQMLMQIKEERETAIGQRQAPENTSVHWLLDKLRSFDLELRKLPAEAPPGLRPKAAKGQVAERTDARSLA